MNVMKRIMFYGILMCMIVSNAQAQENKNNIKTTSFFAGPQVSIATGDLSKTHSWGLGINTLVAHHISEKNSLVGRASYTYLFGKKVSYGYYEPGGGSYSSSYKYKGMNDLEISGGIRHDLTEKWYGGADAGLCMDFGEGRSEASYFGELELGFLFDNNTSSPFVQALAAFLGICGDPKLQVGIRYSIKL